MTRLLFLTHRYLGIGIGALMAMWCLSGLVMMYVSYPQLSERQREAHLAALSWAGCCRISEEALADTDGVPFFQIEMLSGHPVLDLGEGGEAAGRVDLISGAPLAGVLPAQAADIAAGYAQTHPVRLLGRVQRDQWTLEGVSPAAAPLYRFVVDDSAHTQLYVSSVSGRVVQLTTRRERFWSWLGPIPHWLYFTGLRQNERLWTPLIVYSALLGCLLTVIGLYLGVRQLLRAPAGGWSPYRGFSLWHHLAGVLFGALALSWVLSGLLSLNPWGWLEGGDDSHARAQLQGASPTGREVRAALLALAQRGRQDLVSIVGQSFRGQLFLVATARSGERMRLDAQGRAAPLGSPQRAAIATALAGPLRLLSQGDDYYFSHHSSPVQLPAYRVIAPDAVRFYIDPVSGELLASMDKGARGYRWWHQGLHRLDFSQWMRGRPQWDVLMWALMSGATLVCMTGFYLGMRRLLR